MKSLEEREAERAQREAEADESKKQQAAVLATGTLAEGNTGESGESDEGYEGYTVAELKEELDNKGIEYSSSDKKADLVALLEEGSE